ncbi:LysR family transcriptional regulator [Aestuariirhabdus sp. Z084]|uniref:LysR family transcriptional regulator n=1 Tax=Aestuariirhabdus haliotis TaxID=2918751 RepID=UPI00201B411E|nr:LysR family transcriptional regulator [Aestuariirhabdus haliotis]MCL6414064.1 LysR family transcriptional regulator [Aestuariirhabdus haliotis]MCL6417997.1 LysR family transcriptional regulator [Aestuariirhabdus haliotis]
MIDDLRAIAIFAETIKLGSFRRAAQSLGLSPSVVSYHITQLEQRIGTALIYRSTRRLSLSHEGEILYRHASKMLSAIESGISEVASGVEDPTGRLKITLPSALARAPVNQQLARFSQRFPRVELDILYTDHRIDLIADGFDLAIRAGAMPDSALRSKRIGSVERILVCSPDHIGERALPTEPSELGDWNWIKLAMLPNYRRLQHANGASVEVSFTSNLIVNSVEAMTQLCLSGAGVATPPNYLVKAALARGELIELLPHWHVETMPVFACWPGNVSDTSLTRQLVNHLAQLNASVTD